MEAESRPTQAPLEGRIAALEAENARLQAMTSHLNFLDNALDGYFFTNERGELLYLNRALLRMLGYPEEARAALLGRALPIEHWANPAEPTRLGHELLQHGKVYDRHVDLRARGGADLRVRLSAVLAQDAQRRVTGMQYTLHVLPPGPRTDTAELRAENRELAALTAVARSVLSTMNVQEVAQHVMEALLTLFGVEMASVLLQPLPQGEGVAAHRGLTPTEAALLERATGALEFAEQGRGTDHLLFNPGSPLPPTLAALRPHFQMLAATPLRAHERLIGTLVIASREPRMLHEADALLLDRIAQYAGLALQNATLYVDLQRAYDELQEAQGKLMEAERQKVMVEMAGAAAHELNQPLTVLLGYSTILMRQLPEDDRQREILQKIERNTRKISEVVARLGQLTRYRTREYVEGLPIVDLEAASRPEPPGGEGEAPA